MIRRISKNNDYIDIIRSCPERVIDDIYAVKYFIQGRPDVEIEASFTRKGRLLEVILPTSKLSELGNGILMRKSLYRNEDPAFPDGNYDLEFVEDINVWLGDDAVEPPLENDFVTEEEMTSTLSSYATQEWISSQDFLTAETLPSDIATEEWVASQGYLTSVPSEYATQSWVESQGYQTFYDIHRQGYITTLVYHESMTASYTYAYLGTYNESGTQWNKRGMGILGSEIIDTGHSTISVKRGLWVSPSGYMYSFYDEYNASGNKRPHFELIATQEWATSQFLAESKVWVGSRSAWEELTSDQQSLYTIALIVRS